MYGVRVLMRLTRRLHRACHNTKQLVKGPQDNDTTSTIIGCVGVDGHGRLIRPGNRKRSIRHAKTTHFYLKLGRKTTGSSSCHQLVENVEVTLSLRKCWAET